MSDVTRLNYCSHAIADLQDLIDNLRPELGATRKLLIRITQLLHEAVKFVLPERGEVVDIQGLDETMLQMVRLPFPLLALEVPFPTPEPILVQEGPMKETLSTRRIVLAWDETFAAQSRIGKDFKEQGVYALAVYYSDEAQRWMVAPGGVFVPLDNTVSTLASEQSNADPLVAQTLLDKHAVTAKTRVVQANFFPALPQFAEMLAQEIGREQAQARLQLDIRDEMMCLHAFCLAVNCVNVQQGILPTEPKLNAKRIKNGKPPLYEYRVLELPEPRVREGSGVRLEGLRNAPRIHLRRGHPRKLADGRLTFVQAALIGTANAGIVEKEYRVAASSAVLP